MKYKKLPRSYYRKEDVVALSKDMLGKVLVTEIGGVITSGIIVETEAYKGVIDKASHAYNGRRTARTEIMFGDAGTAYIYLCYGIHHLFNVVTNKKDIPHAILIRALEPLEGIEVMLKRRKKKKIDFTLTKGPGSLSQAMGLHTKDSGHDLTSDKIWIEDRGIKIPTSKIKATKRIGVDYAGKDALLKYRFILKDSKWVSG